MIVSASGDFSCSPVAHREVALKVLWRQLPTLLPRSSGPRKLGERTSVVTCRREEKDRMMNDDEMMNVFVDSLLL